MSSTFWFDWELNLVNILYSSWLFLVLVIRHQEEDDRKIIRISNQESLNVELEDLITAASAVMHMTATLMVYMPSAVKWEHRIEGILQQNNLFWLFRKFAISENMDLVTVTLSALIDPLLLILCNSSYRERSEHYT